MSTTVLSVASPLHTQHSISPIRPTASFPHPSPTPRTRTTSLLSSVSTKVPMLVGRISFGRQKDANNKLVIEVVDKGKAKAKENEVVAGVLPKSPKSRSFLPSRIVSSPFATTSTSPHHPPLASTPARIRVSSKPTAPTKSGLADYQRRAAAFSRSSPDLGTLRVTRPLAWPADDEKGDTALVTPPLSFPLQDVTSTEISQDRTAAWKPTFKSSHPSPDVVVASDPTISPSSEAKLSSSTKSDMLARSPSLSRRVSVSPPPSEEHRRAAHAEALARLTEGTPVQEKSDPFSRRPPPPSRSPPPIPSSPFPTLASQPSTPPPRPRKASLRAKSPKSPRASEEQAISDLSEEAKEVKSFVDKYLGPRALDRCELHGQYEVPGNAEEESLWAALYDGVTLCRLLNALSPSTAPVPSPLIDRRGLPASGPANLSRFLAATSRTFTLPSDDLFTVSDIVSGRQSGMREVLRTLRILDERTVTPNNSHIASSTLSFDINMKGRAVRARNSKSDHSTDQDKPLLEVPATDLPARYSDAARSAWSTSTVDSDDRQSPEVTWEDSSITFETKGKIYLDRRMAESAIDVLAIVEEDEAPYSKDGRPHVRYSQPLNAPRSSPSKRAVKRHSLDASTSRRSEIPALVPLVIPKGRQRHSSEMSRPKGLMGQRSVSNSATQPTRLELEDRGPILIGSDLRSPRPRSRPGSPLSSVPFPTSSSPVLGAGEGAFNNLPRPRQHQRWNSEIYIDRGSGHQDAGVGPRSRHASLAVGDEDTKVSRVARTKLVLRESGRPTLTYQLGECIGRGQFGSVYRALNLNSGRVVAVKRIQLEGKSEEEILQLSNEVALLKSLQHPAVVKYEGVVRTEHYVNIILEFVENGSLQKTMKNFGELPEGLVASFVVKILEGLDYLHSKRVVHCDLKAANILSTKTGNIKLSDFGVSLNLNAVQHIQQDVNDVAGTPNWMAPEVIELKGASTASDIWSLACTIIELITGRPPYAELNAMSAMFRIVEDDRPPIPAKCSSELCDFLSQCFRKDPLARPTAADLFEHEWLQLHWDPHKELRPQDSIPFLRRISSEMRRGMSPELGDRSPTPQDLAYLSSSPNSSRSPLTDLRRFSHDSQWRASEEMEVRPSLDLAAQNFDGVLSSPIEPPEPLQPHAFVRTSFTKAVDCRLCHEKTKRHAVLCKDCGIISHSRCAEFAPLPCDLRTQLLNYSRNYIGPTSPSSASEFSLFRSPGSSSPNPTTGFSFGNMLPFAGRRKSTSTPPLGLPQLQSRPSIGDGARPAPPPPPPAPNNPTPTKGARRSLTNLMIGRSAKSSPGASSSEGVPRTNSESTTSSPSPSQHLTNSSVGSSASRVTTSGNVVFITTPVPGSPTSLFSSTTPTTSATNSPNSATSIMKRKTSVVKTPTGNKLSRSKSNSLAVTKTSSSAGTSATDGSELDSPPPPQQPTQRHRKAISVPKNDCVVQ